MRKIYVEITPFFPSSDSFRGPYVYDQVMALKKTARFTDVVVLKPTSLFDKRESYEYNGVIVYFFPFLEMPSYLLNGLLNRVNKWIFKLWFKKYFPSLVSDIVVAHAHVSTFGVCSLALKELNPSIKAVLQHHDLDPYTVRNGRWADKAWNVRYRARKNVALFEQLDCHICVSKEVENSLQSFPEARKGESYESYLDRLEQLKGMRKAKLKRLLVLYNGVDCDKYFPLSGTIRKNTFRIGCIANFVELKGHITLLTAMQILVVEKDMRDIHLSLIGSGPLLDECKAFVADHQLENYISFEKEVDHDQLPDYYRSLDLFVLPSYFEGLGCVFTEAAACGVPFMTCENQGIQDYVLEEERPKWLFPRGDYRRLAELIEGYKKNPVAQKMAQPYDIDCLIENFLKELNLW